MSFSPNTREVRPTVLVLRALGLGDLLTGVPALRAIHRALPCHRLVLATPSSLKPLVEIGQLADEVLPTSTPEHLRWEGTPPALAVDLHGNGPRSRNAVLRTKPRRVLAFGGDSIAGYIDGPRWRTDEHEVARWCRLVAELPGASPDPTDLGLPQPAPLFDPPYAVIHVGAASGARRWPAERFAALISEMPLPVYLTGNANERPIAEAVAAQASVDEDRVLAGRTELLELASLVAGASVVVSGDTGGAHLASAFGTPSVVLFGPISPALWGPPASGPHVALWHGTSRGDPHAEQPDPALLAITVDEVASAVRCLLSGSGLART